MQSKLPLWLIAATVGAQALSIRDNQTASLGTLCTVDYVTSSLPEDGFYNGITLNPSSVTTQLNLNVTTPETDFWFGDVISYCDVQLSYTHDGRDDQVLVEYWFPAPDVYQNRFLATGGGGYAINSGNSSLPAGPIYGAVSGVTDGGFGGFDVQVDAVILLANGSLNWEAAYMFGYQGIHEMTVIGKAISQNFYGTGDAKKIYGYYQGCSEGGREGWSQVQRFAKDYDGASIGAPAMRYGMQQVNHLSPGVIMETMGHIPSSCELDAIATLLTDFCDPLDGKTDGVVARSDLCKLNFNLNSTIGQPYSCAASGGGGAYSFKRQAGGGGYGGGGSTPAVNGTISAQTVAVAQAILNGLKDSQGRQVYFYFQPGAGWGDASSEYNSTSGEYYMTPTSLGGEWVTKFLELLDLDNLATLDGITPDTLRDWMYYGFHTYEDSLQTTWPDLTDYQAAGGKVIHFHGESDDSVPTASSVRYWDSVRSVMFGSQSYDESVASLNDFYRFFSIPGGAHCHPGVDNSPWPMDTVGALIDWVENDINPETLTGTILSGDNEGVTENLCSFPLRPLWSNNGTTMDCVFDQASLDTWIYDLNAFRLPIY